MEKRYDFLQVEKQMQELWEKEKTYFFDKDAKGEIYSIDTPPPTVSGSLHIGHLFSYTQAEIIARFRRMQGYNVFYPFGFDDNGLPTERLVERDQGIRANSLPQSQFTDKCQKTAETYERDFKSLWKSLGFSVDWSAEYRTISPQVRQISQQLFLELVKMGKAYAKESPVLWCTECQTSIAQAELDSVETESVFHYIPFMVDGFPLKIATTRPELLYGCVCLFVNPQDERYQAFIGKSAVVPVYNYEIPILSDENVCAEKGTGVVMCATFGDSTDALWFTRYSLPYRQVITATGKIAENVPLIAGLSVDEARKEMIRILVKKNLLLKSEPISHTVGTHERCGKETEIILSKQWYIDILSERKAFLEAADKINWYPRQMKKRYIDWVENLKWDWCISRQRYFGVPFPVWYCKECGAAVYANQEELPVNPLETEYKGKCKCGSRVFIPESAVFDTWATSSITPQINERLGLKLSPMSMRTHAHEIIRTWTFYTIVRSLYHTGNIPWKDLMICGFVLAKKGEKISKSKSNNEFDPQYLIKTHSADVLRYWTAGARLGTDTFFSPEELAVSKRFITKLWNASKFAVSHLQDVDLTQKPRLLPIDEWMIARTNEAAMRAGKLLYAYEIGSAKHEMDTLFWNDFCDNYIEIVKERLYEPEIHGLQGRKSGQYALYYALLNILKMYAIYVPHITEYIYRSFFLQHEKTASLHKTTWVKPAAVEDGILEFGEKIKKILADVRKYKSEQNLSMRAEMDAFHLETESVFAKRLALTVKDLKACTRAKEISITICEREE